jgi:hypothetical protein
MADEEGKDPTAKKPTKRRAKAKERKKKEVPSSVELFGELVDTLFNQR